MSRRKFSDECDGCKPVIIDTDTGKAMSDDSPPMRAIMKIWSEMSPEQKQAWHRFTCLNSRAAEDLAVIQKISEKFRALAQE